jgi:microcystin-dependent protein
MGTKIISLPSADSVQSDAYIPVSQDITGNNRTTYKITAQQLASFIGSTTSSGTVNRVEVQSSDSSLSVTGSPITTKGVIDVKLNGVTLDKIASGGATNGQVLTYDYINHQWKPIDSAVTGVTADSVQIGTVLWFAASSAPLGYLECDGSSKSISIYNELFAVLGTTYGNLVNGGTEFILPDLRGEFIRGWDHNKGVDSGRTFGSTQSDDFKSHTHTFNSYGGQATAGTGGNGWYANATRTTDATGGTETRPKNIALLPCIKALKTVQGTTSVLNFIEKPTNPKNGQLLSYNETTNLWQAISANDFSNKSLAENGYQVFPGGLIIQWGSTGTISNNSASNVSFPKTFPNSVASVTVTPAGGVYGGGQGVNSAANVSTSGFTICNGLDNNMPFYWTAIGW